MVAKFVGGQIVGTSTESQYVIHTTLITDEDLKNDDALSACPAIYQNFLEKLCDIRVTVVGDEIFACRIKAQQREDAYVDWRAAGHAALDIQQCKLEASIADRCRALMRELGLQTAGINLIDPQEGHTVFLEINAAAQWVWVQEATGLPIAASIARRLASACDGASVSAQGAMSSGVACADATTACGRYRSRGRSSIGAFDAEIWPLEDFSLGMLSKVTPCGYAQSVGGRAG